MRPRSVRLMLAAMLALAGSAAVAGCGGAGDSAAGRSLTPASAGPSASGSLPAPSGPLTSTSVPPASVPTGQAPTRTFPVGKREDTVNRDGRVLRTTTWYPKAGGLFPAVLFSHGLRGEPADFEPLLTRWAAAGFVVVAPAYPHTHRDAADFDLLDVLNQPADATAVFNAVLAGPLKPSIDPQRLGAAGHSAGAITTVGLFTSARDARLRAGVVLAGAAFGVGTKFAAPAVPLLFVHGDADGVVSYAAGKAVFDAAPPPKAMLSLPGQDHSDPYLYEGGNAFRAVAATTLDFLRYALYGDTAARARLAGDAKPAGAWDSRL